MAYASRKNLRFDVLTEEAKYEMFEYLTEAFTEAIAGIVLAQLNIAFTDAKTVLMCRTFNKDALRRKIRAQVALKRRRVDSKTDGKKTKKQKVNHESSFCIVC